MQLHKRKVPILCLKFAYFNLESAAFITCMAPKLRCHAHTPPNHQSLSPKTQPNLPPIGWSVEKTPAPEGSEKILALDKICLENGKHLGSFKNLGGGKHKQFFQNTRKMHLFIAGANLCNASKCIS